MLQQPQVTAHRGNAGVAEPFADYFDRDTFLEHARQVEETLFEGLAEGSE
jgi:hypothetical protein